MWYDNDLKQDLDENTDDIDDLAFSLRLVRIIPNYRYDPKHAGRFHNYLTGILRNKAVDRLRAFRRDGELKKEVVAEAARQKPTDDRTDELREAMEICLNDFLSDATVAALTKQVFLRIAVRGEAVVSRRQTAVPVTLPVIVGLNQCQNSIFSPIISHR